MADHPQQKHWFSETKIVSLALGALAVVLTYEILKAREHVVLISSGQSPDVPFTLLWVFDVLTAGIVTFALVYVSLSFRRMDERLRDHEVSSERLLQELQNTASDVTGVHKELNRIKGDIQHVSAGLISKEKVLTALYSETMLKDSLLHTSFMKGLEKLTSAWSSLIEAEFANPYGIIDDTSYGLLCWRIAIQAYLEEEASDINVRTIATNIRLYIKLIESLVDEVLDKTKNTTWTVDLFASANILPADYYNWPDPTAKSDHHAGLGISNFFMEGYRTKIRSWIEMPSGPTLTRVFLVNDLDREDNALLGGMYIQPLQALRDQAHLKILCDSGTGRPSKMTVEQASTYRYVPPLMLEEKRGSETYAIAERYKNVNSLAQDQLKEASLFEVLAHELHTPGAVGTINPHARYLAITKDENLGYLKFLPKIPSSRGIEINSPDFLVIRLKGADTVKAIACIAAELDPDFETMALRLITSERELREIDKFIEYATADSEASMPIASLLKR